MKSEAEPLYGLGRLPREKASHHLADYLELLCMTSPDGEVSAGDLVDRWLEGRDVGETDDEEEPIGESEGAQVDRYRGKVEDAFRHLTYRAGTFGDSYPFAIGDTLVLRRKSRMTLHRKLYIFLLLASSLRYMKKEPKKRLERMFENLGTEVLRRWLPGHANVYGFGTASSGRYRGRAAKRYKRLAEDLRDVPHLSDANFPVQSVGDLGLDSVAWFSLGDGNPGIVVIFAQTTCMTHWEGKQNESGIRWRDYLPPKAPRGNILFIPFCFRAPDGAWFDEKWIYDAVVIDRVRLNWLLRDEKRAIDPVPYDIVDRAWAQRELVV